VLARLLDLRADPRTVLRGSLGRVKRAAWSEPIPLDRVRALGRATGGTINDVLLSAVAGRLRRYLAAAATASTAPSCAPWCRQPARGARHRVARQQVRPRLPAAARGRGPTRSRAWPHQAQHGRDQAQPRGVVVFGLLRAFGKTTAAVLVDRRQLLARRASAVMTNVPGPRARIRFAGAPWTA
jgi:hypothetical protein